MPTWEELSPTPPGELSWDSLSDTPPKPPEGGFLPSAKQSFGSLIKGAGQAAADYIPGVDQDNAVKSYGQKIIDANPTAVHNFGDIADKPLTAVTEAAGNAGASIGGMVGARVLGQGITAVSPLAGPLAPAVALAGQAVSWFGPAAIAALPSYGGIRDKQILNDPANQDDWKSKAIASVGAATVGAIESKFGPQDWALSALTKEGRAALASKFAETTLAKSIGFGALKGAAIEGAEELVQNPIEQLASYDNPTTPENLKETAFSGVMGAIGGGVFGGATGIVAPRAKTPQQAVADIANAPDVDSAIKAAEEAVNAGPKVDDFLASLQSMKDATRTGGVLQRLRDMGDASPVSIDDFLNALSVASNPVARMDQRILARDQVNQIIEQMTSGTGFTMPGEQAEPAPATSTALATQQGGALATPVQGMQFDPNTIDGQTRFVDELPGQRAIGGPRALTGPNDAAPIAPTPGQLTANTRRQDPRLIPMSRREQSYQPPQLPNVQNATPGTPAQAQAAPVEAPKDAGVAAVAKAVPAAPGSAGVEAAGVADGPGSDVGNGFKRGPQEGERYRVGVSSATGGVTIEKRLPAGTVATFYVGKDGGLIDADDVNLVGTKDREKLWIPPNKETADQVTAILDGMGKLALSDPKRRAAKEQLKALVTRSSPVEAAGVKTLSKMLTLKSTTLMRDDGNGRRLYDVAVSPEFRNKHFVNGRMPVVDGLELKPKSDVTGNVYDRGWVLIDNREQLANRRGNDVKQEIGGETGEGSVSNGTLDNPRPVTLPVNKPEGPVFYGTGHRLLTEGGKPFKTKRAADDAKRLQPMMRVKKVKGGYVLTEKTPAQIAAQARAAARLAAGSTGDAGMPQHAHGFMAREGGLSKEAMSDLGLDRNQRIGSMWLFKANGGMTLEQATEKLVEGGYLKEGASHSDAINLIKKSITTPQYTADGWERIAQAEADARFEDHLAAQEESAQNEDFDPFASSLDEGFDLSDIDGVGYDEASDPIKLEVNALLAQAESLGIDTESIRENEYENTKNGSEQDYFEAFKRALASAIEAGNRDSSPDSGEASNAQGSQEGLTAVDQHNKNSVNSDDFISVLNGESVGGNAGAGKAGVNVSFDDSGRIASIGNTQDLPAEIRARINSGELHEATFTVAVPDNKIVAVQFRGQSVPGDAKDQINKLVGVAYNPPTAQDFLTSPTREDILAKQQAEEDAAKAKEKADKEQEEKDRAERIQKEIDARQRASAENFILGQNAEDALAGQGDVFNQPEQPAAVQQSDEDWMQTLFGGSAQATPAESVNNLDAPALRKLIQSLVTDLQAQRADWDSREYKGNSNRVNLRGDGPSNQESLSITSINEGRRTKVLQSIDSQLKQLDKLDTQIETTAGANEFMQLVQSTWDKAQAFKPQSPDQLSGGALFESLMIDALKLQPAQGSYTSLPITKALREMMDSGKAEPAAKATAILDAAEVKGKERIDVLKDVKSGTITPEEVQAAYPAKEAAKIEDIGEKIGGARKDTAISTGPKGKSQKQNDERPTWAKRFNIGQIAGGFDISVNGRDVTGKWVISDTKRLDRFGKPSKVGEYFDSKEAAEKALPLLAVAQKHRVVPGNRVDGIQTYEIWRDVNDRKRVKVVDLEFTSRTDAMQYMADHATEIIETNTTFGEADLPKPDNVQRIGAVRRTGDVKGEDFMQVFGLRGVEFGNWNNQEERQEVMNEAYDGLLDMAEILNVPAKAIGLNGDLALAFGARGKGLSGARAHYETDRVVMNLTKMNGAGALAHEWFHALDHYLARQDGKSPSKWKMNADGTRSLEVVGGDGDMASSGFRIHNSGVREELRQAYTKLVRSLFNKAEQYVEDTARADKFVAVSRGELEEALSKLRQDLSEQKDAKYYKRNNKPASAEQLAEFDRIAAELVEGRGIETEWRVLPGKTRTSVVSRFTNEALEKLSEINKAVRGRSGFDTTDRNGTMDRLSGYMRRYNERLKMLADANNASTKTKNVPTSFAMDAKSLDQGRGGDYWTTPHEMAARAFQGYVEDKIAEKEGRSPFLNYAPENLAILTPWGAKRPYPSGAERKAMNAEFENFIGVIQTKEDEFGNVAMFSRGKNADVANAWTSLASNEKAFSYPSSDAKTMDGIADDMGNPLHLIDEPGSVGDDVAHAWRAYPKDIDGNPELEKNAFVIQYKDGKIELNVDKFNEGDAGSFLYALVGAYAHNNGLKFEGDRYGITEAGMERRLENMISLALKYGSSDFIAPHEKQLAYLGMKWKTGDNAFNLEQMLIASYRLAAKKLPQIKDYIYDFDTGTTTHIVGGVELDDAGRTRLRKSAREAGLRAGERTIARAVFTNTILNETTPEGRRRLLERINSWARGTLDKTYVGSLYSRNGDAQDTAAISQVQNWVNQLSAKWKNGPEIQVVSSIDDLPVPAASDTRGLYYRGTVYLVASRIGSKKAAGEVLAHESIAHYGLREMLGESDWYKFMRQMQTAIKSGNKPLNAIRDQIRSVYVDENGKPNLTEIQEADEIAAKAVEMAIDPKTGEFNPGFGFLKSVFAKVAQFLRDVGFDVKFTNLELQGALVNAMRNLEVGNRTHGGAVSPAVAAREDAQAARNDQTQTPEFKRWFGDSKVVDADGKPLVVYHGSPEQFFTFDKLKQDSTSGASKNAFWFTSDKSATAQFGRNITDAYLSAKSLFEVDAQSLRQYFPDFGTASPAVVVVDGKAKTVDINREVFVDGKDQNVFDLLESNRAQPVMENNTRNRVMDAAKRAGADGVVFKGFYDASDNPSDIYAVFNPTQVKSATGNNGNFDPQNPDIRYARGTNAPVTNPNDVVGNQGGRSADDSIPGALVVATDKTSSVAVSRLNKVLRDAGWEVEYIDIDLTAEKPKATIRVNRDDGRYLIAKVDAIGRANFETFQRERNLGMNASTRGRRPLTPLVDDTFLGRHKFEGARSMLRGMTHYLTDNASTPINLADMRSAWAGVMNAPIKQEGIALLPNEPTAPDSFGAPMASRSRIVGQTTRQHTPEQIRAMENVGFKVEVPTLKERIQSLTQDMGKKMAQGIVDQFAPVKDLDSKAYGLLRLAKGASGAFEAMLKGGQLKITDGVYDFDDSKKGGVVDRLLIPLGGEHHDFFRWIAANRAERLQAEGKENLFSAQDIAALKTLDQGTAEFDYTIQNGANKGKVTRDRTLIYKDSLITFNEFNTNVLNMAEQSGLIDGASRKLWEHEFYVPFYRVAEEGEGINGMNIKGAAVRQQAFKKLKGGKQALNADLLDNTLMNWAHLIDASAKNRAAKATIEAAERMGVAVGGNQSTLEQMASSIGQKSNVTWFMDGGTKRYSLVEDPYILTAISSLQYAGMKNPVMNAMSFMKHALTVGVTASPFFKIRNLIRDSVQVIGTSNIDANPAKNIAQGWKLTDPKSDDYFRLLAGGGTIHFGTMMEGSESKRIQALVESGVDSGTILNDGQKVKAFYRKWVEPGITAYNELGNRGEAVNRAALYQQLRSQGIDHAEASLMARDLMDFSMQGSWASIRFLTQIVPFLNARLQGMYKLGRAAKEDPQRFGATLGAVAAVSLGLLAAYGDDDDWRRREDWDRNGFWWFKFGGTAFRIPKPFEIGAIATLAERGFELAFDKEMTNKRFMAQVMTIAGDNLSMNPIPQLVKPLLDVYANKDSFSGRPIETMSMERLKSEYRFTQNTSMTARAVSTGINAVTGIVNKEGFSPVQIDHMLRGYFGWLGSFIVGAADVLARPATDQPDKATPDYWKVATGGIVSDLRDAPSRYVSQMYAQAKDIEQAYGTWKSLVKEGKIEESRDFFEGHKEEISAYRNIERVKSAESKLNERIRMIERSAMNPDKKRELIRELQKAKEQRAKVLQPA